jgi:hypothetical protein
VRKSVDDEPTAHPVLARMSAWEQMSSAQVVSDIKKVNPGDCTPVRPPAPKTPATTGRTPGQFGAAASATPSLESKKSFKDSIKVSVFKHKYSDGQLLRNTRKKPKISLKTIKGRINIFEVKAYSSGNHMNVSDHVYIVHCRRYIRSKQVTPKAA